MGFPGFGVFETQQVLMQGPPNTNRPISGRFENLRFPARLFGKSGTRDLVRMSWIPATRFLASPPRVLEGVFGGNRVRKLTNCADRRGPALPPSATPCRPLAPRTPFWRKLRRKRAGWALPLPPSARFWSKLATTQKLPLSLPPLLKVACAHLPLPPAARFWLHARLLTLKTVRQGVAGGRPRQFGATAGRDGPGARIGKISLACFGSKLLAPTCRYPLPPAFGSTRAF